ncbi:hypothetical protein FACS1894147_03420 [Spirochaetia bacterium]|nr:hypothetical protein FACS1894147_03420 [Spirochaetia bacterium]
MLTIEGIHRACCTEHPFHRGDVIYAERNAYRHYGIYAGNNKVIHFTPRNGDFGVQAAVRETSLARFAKGNRIAVSDFSHNSGQVYSPDGTVRRARSKIGQGGYNLVFNNCEHFANWCKTGKRHSRQVENAVQEIAEKALGGVVNVLEFIANGLDNLAAAI